MTKLFGGIDSMTGTNVSFSCSFNLRYDWDLMNSTGRVQRAWNWAGTAGTASSPVTERIVFQSPMGPDGAHYVGDGCFSGSDTYHYAFPLLDWTGAISTETTLTSTNASGQPFVWTRENEHTTEKLEAQARESLSRCGGWESQAWGTRVEHCPRAPYLSLGGTNVTQAARPTVQAISGASCPKSREKTMKPLSVIVSMILLSCAAAFSVETPCLPGFADAVEKTGDPYRRAVALITNDTEAARHLHEILAREPADSAQARHARIFLARIQHPEVFSEFADEIRKWREKEKSSQPNGGRPGFLSGTLLAQVVRRGPESRFVDERVRDAHGKGLCVTNGLAIRGLYHKKVEKYTDAEVQAGIARNAAARQAVLEHFLKFIDEGDVYEQSEMAELANDLWGKNRRILNAGDPAVIDHVQDIDALFEAFFRNVSLPAAARMFTALRLADTHREEVRAFMLKVTTDAPVEDRYRMGEDAVQRASYYLASTADVPALGILKTQTNGPAQKRDMTDEARRAIEIRPAAPQKDASRHSP